jgi:addiction module HigA family antidote
MERTTNGLPPIHPGEYIREALADLGMTQTALAQALGVSAMRISHLVREERPVTAEMALRLGQAFGQSPQYWLNLQVDYDLKIAKAVFKDSLRQVRELAVA